MCGPCGTEMHEKGRWINPSHNILTYWFFGIYLLPKKKSKEKVQNKKNPQKNEHDILYEVLGSFVIFAYWVCRTWLKCSHLKIMFFSNKQNLNFRSIMSSKRR